MMGKEKRLDYNGAHMAHFQSTAGRVYFDEKGFGEPLIFVHGRTLDSRMWQPQIDKFSKNYRCITYDLNGFGQSEIPKNGYDPVLTLRELYDHLKINKATIIALSLGTHIVINFALENPELVDKLVLMSCTISGAEFGQEFMDDWNAVESQAMAGDLKKAKELWINCRAFGQLKGNRLENYELFLKMVAEYTGWDIINPPKKMPRPGVMERLGEITAPTLVMTGDKDYPDFRKNGEILGSSLPNARTEIIKNSSHMVNLEFPELVNELIGEFLVAGK
ncbi:alpha/beta hydrolase [Candidatus Shapirobacteria bacterium]|nr:alpha/beta hydrolase [Candidatus Shapirobacteria bacterium]